MQFPGFETWRRIVETVKKLIGPIAVKKSTIPHDFDQSSGNLRVKMFAAKRFLTVIIVCAILLGRNFVNGSRASCPKSAVVDLTQETPETSGDVTKSGLFFPREAVQHDDDGRFGCICDIRRCRPYCCPLGGAASLNGCVEDKYTRIFSKFEGSLDANKFHVFVNDPCQLSFFEITSTKKYNRPREAPLDILFRKYCVLRKVNSIEYLYGLCLDGRSLFGLLFSGRIHAWSLTCEIVRIFLTLITLIVYSVTPELKNLQGLLLRCYIGSELTSHTLFYVSYIIWNAGSTLIYTISLWVTGNVSIIMQYRLFH